MRKQKMKRGDRVTRGDGEWNGWKDDTCSIGGVCLIQSAAGRIRDDHKNAGSLFRRFLQDPCVEAIVYPEACFRDQIVEDRL